nr:MAG TPA: ATP synthase subunit a [Caudoviricetes sp.]
MFNVGQFFIQNLIFLIICGIIILWVKKNIKFTSKTY